MGTYCQLCMSQINGTMEASYFCGTLTEKTTLKLREWSMYLSVGSLWRTGSVYKPKQRASNIDYILYIVRSTAHFGALGEQTLSILNYTILYRCRHGWIANIGGLFCLCYYFTDKIIYFLTNIKYIDFTANCNIKPLDKFYKW